MEPWHVLHSVTFFLHSVTELIMIISPTMNHFNFGFVQFLWLAAGLMVEGKIWIQASKCLILHPTDVPYSYFIHVPQTQ